MRGKRHPGWRGHDLGSAKARPWSPHVILVLGVVSREPRSPIRTLRPASIPDGRAARFGLRLVVRTENSEPKTASRARPIAPRSPGAHPVTEHRRYRPVDLTSRRECRYPGCRRRSVRGHAFCAPHGVTDEAVAYYRELQQASAYFDLALQSLDPDQAERAEAYHRFRRRAQRGDFSQLLDKPTRALIEQAAALPDHALEIGVLRLALARAVAEETDPSRMGLTVARLTHAIARISAANPTTDTDRATTAALRLLDTALPPSGGLPSPMIGRGVGGEGRPAGPEERQE